MLITLRRHVHPTNYLILSWLLAFIFHHKQGHTHFYIYIQSSFNFTYLYFSFTMSEASRVIVYVFFKLSYSLCSVHLLTWLPSLMSAQCRCHTKCRTTHGWSNGQRGSHGQWNVLKCPYKQAKFRVPSRVAVHPWRIDDGLQRQRCEASW